LTSTRRPVGYQSMPTTWGIDTDRKRAFFGCIKQISGVPE
jgi:hypothetical protein